MNDAYNIETIFEEALSSVADAPEKVFDRMAQGSNRPLVLVGAGLLGRKCLNGLRRHSIKVLAFVDNNPQKWGTEVDGIQVLSPAVAGKKYGKLAAFVVTIWAPRQSYREAACRLREFGIDTIVPFPALIWKFPDDLLPHYQFETPQYYLQAADNIKKAFTLLDDAESQRQFYGHLRWRLLLDYDALPTPSFNDQYFPKDILSIVPNEVFVDCGAYDGDTVRSLLWNCCEYFERIYAFEPDPVNYNRLETFVKSLNAELAGKIQIAPWAVGSQRGQAKFDAPGATRSSITSSGEISVDVVALQDVLLDSAVTYLKLDVEGVESDALKGALELIEKCRPVIGVCVYHCPSDFFDLPLFLSKYCPEYRFHLRSHDEDGLEMVIYAVPNERILVSI